MTTFFDPIRRCNVRATAEERVRQRLLAWMVDVGGYKAANIAVEKEIATLPHIVAAGSIASLLPKRRADIIVFAKAIHPVYDLFPLLLIECKANTPLTAQHGRQLLGYNSFVQAPFCALVNEKGALTALWGHEADSHDFVEGFFDYETLLMVSKKSSQGVMSDPSESTTARSMTLANSRTLPGQG